MWKWGYDTLFLTKFGQNPPPKMPKMAFSWPTDRALLKDPEGFSPESGNFGLETFGNSIQILPKSKGAWVFLCNPEGLVPAWQPAGTF